jgi:hypothetical protein
MITIVDEHRRGIALGAAGYRTKPIDRERLRRVIGRFRAPADRDVLPMGLLLQGGDDGKPVHLRHHQIKQDYVYGRCSDDMRELIEDEWPELMHKLPPKVPTRR